MSVLYAAVPCAPARMRPSGDLESRHARPAARGREGGRPIPASDAREVGSRTARANRDVGWQRLAPPPHAIPESSGANTETRIAGTAGPDVPLPFVATPTLGVRSPGGAPLSRSLRPR